MVQKSLNIYEHNLQSVRKRSGVEMVLVTVAL